jgi:ParB family chromosome partitioning protein
MNTKKVPVSEISIPDTRVTAVYDEELQQLLKETMAAMGMLTPIVVVQTPVGYRLVDGLHRLQEKKAAGETSVDAVVYEGEEKDSLLMNLVLNRIRGKTKASEMVKVIGSLFEDYKMDPDAIKEKTGLNRDYIEKLIKISRAAPSVQELLDQEIIGVGHAFEIARLPTFDQQNEVCAKTQLWRWTVKEIKELVDETLRIMANPSSTGTPPPPPVAIKYHCEGCQKELESKYLKPVMLCPDCFGIVWRQQQPPTAAPAKPSDQPQDQP